MDLENNLNRLRTRIERICVDSGRMPESIDILPVTKYKSIELIKKLQSLGFRTVGENYIQEIKKKYLELPGIDWVAIGHLQTNKASMAVHLCQTILSVDSLRLAQSLNRESQRLKKNINVWIQIDLWDQRPPKGCRKQDVGLLLDFIDEAPYLDLQGLMVLPPQGDASAFAQSNGYRLDLEQKLQRTLSLSMGMSGDLELAIRHGSNQLRIGSALLGPR
ncbi:MAG: YggS family pyridoxal phosphate-dependent enzyme [Holophagaceae bacterium]